MTVPRTLWVTNDFPPRAGGIEAFVGELAGRLDPAGVCVLTARAAASGAHDARLTYPVHRVAARPLLPGPGLLRTVRAAASAHRAEVVVFGASWPLGELAGRIDLPTVALTHGHEAGMVRVGLGPLVRRVARRLDAIGVISGFTHRMLDPWVGEHTTVHDLPPGVDTIRFHPQVDGSPVRSQLGLEDGQPLVVCVSRLVARKGQDTLVEVWPRVRDRVPGAHLLLVGGGPMADQLRQRVAALGLEDAVTLAGPVTRAVLPAVHAAADVFAMPCRTRLAGLDVEGLGIVYLEAQACGTPVLAGRSGGAPESLLDGETGVVTDGSCPTTVGDALLDLLSDPDGRVAMGTAGRAFVERHYAWPVVTDRFRMLLRDMAGGATRS